MADKKTANAHEGIPVDLGEALLKMAEAERLKPEDLNKMVTLRRSQYYEATIRAHYKALDQGYAQGMKDGLRARAPSWVWFLVGAAAPYVITFLVRLVVFIGHVYNSSGG